ncbi:ribonuclease J [Candidatus Woesearchaeota archaeon]|nr:ribonuclease J [Candidatus Woesearchaeota archaeon]|tara:strand:- start:2164 stop:3480 length:1317 start_codon:yes stop_codon:yes gene_type:complete
MVLEIIPVGGYGEIGRNSTLIRYNDEAVLLDLGLHMEHYVALTEDEDVVKMNPQLLMDHNAVPDIRKIKEWIPKIKAIAISHAHLDHLGAIPFLGDKFPCPIHGSPYTISVLKALLKDDGITVRNDLLPHSENSIFPVSKHIKLEFISATHSIPQAVMICVHTPEGNILYTNDFKLDFTPVIGKKPNLKRLKELKLKAVIVDSLYADDPRHTPSEAIAKEMLKDTLYGIDTKGKAIIVTTFSSHIARLKSIIEIGTKLGRKIVFLGRSLAKYATAAEDIGLVQFSKEVEMVQYGSKIKRELAKIKKPDEYIFVVTGHQGEPKATLSKMLNKKLFNFKPEDIVIFSCKTIPTPVNLENRERLESELKSEHIRIFKDIHVSGHAGREDIRELLHLLNTEQVIPSHGTPEKNQASSELAQEIGFSKEKTPLLKNGDLLKLS